MIVKFDEFKINELQQSTYRSASKKLVALGGKHAERARKLSHWALVSNSKDLGTFNVNLDIISREFLQRGTTNYKKVTTTKNTENRLITGDTLVESGPIPIYITGAWCIDPAEQYDPSDYTSEMRNIGFVFYGACVSDLVEESIELFYLSVDIEWSVDVDSPTFRVVDGSVKISECGEGIVTFSDRKSALKFRNKYLSESNIKSHTDEIDGVKDFFFEYSTAQEWTKLFKEMRSIPINMLYK